LKITESLKNIIDTKFASLDDFTRKQKLFALSSKLENLISNAPENKKPLYVAMKKVIDSYIQ